MLGAVVRYLLGVAWPIPLAYPPPSGFPLGIVVVCLTAGVSLFVAGLTFIAVSNDQFRAFTLGLCAGVASLGQLVTIGVTTAATAGLVLLVLGPLCALIGLSAGVFLALSVRARTSPTDGAVTE